MTVHSYMNHNDKHLAFPYFFITHFKKDPKSSIPTVKWEKKKKS